MQLHLIERKLIGTRHRKAALLDDIKRAGKPASAQIENRVGLLRENARANNSIGCGKRYKFHSALQGWQMSD